MSTNGNDDINFALYATLGQLTTVLVNAYSGQTITIDEEMNIHTGAIIDGLGGTDSINMTNHGDFLSLHDVNTGMQVIFNVERFFAGSGGDIIVMDSETVELGDLMMFGSGGNDILWGNVGNDQIFGGPGDDLIDGGPGNDWVSGEGDDDIVGGGAGDDLVEGGAGNDILYGGYGVLQHIIDKQFSDTLEFPELQEGVNIADLGLNATDNLGVVEGNLTVDFDTTVTLTFRDGFAGYNNTLGAYQVLDDGTIASASVLWGNVKDAGIDVTHTVDLDLGANGGAFGFFIVADGNDVNGGYAGLDITGDGVLSFIYDYGGANERAANIADDASMISLVYNDGVTTTVINGPIYHTTGRDGETNLNPDGQIHAISGLVSLDDNNLLRVGFEDLPNLGDADYEDVLFDLDITAVVEPGINGTGNDVLNGGAGADILYGEDGADTFLFTVMDGNTDLIMDFSLAEGDIIDIADLLTGYDDGVDDINDFLMMVNNGGDTELHVNADGDIGGVFDVVASLENTALGVGLEDLIASGNLVVV